MRDFLGQPYDDRDYRSTARAARIVATRFQWDVGLERNPLFGWWDLFLLPKPHNRSGHELRCEVIRPGEPL